MRTFAKYVTALTIGVLAAAVPAQASLTQPFGTRFVYNEVMTINRFDAAFDSTNQVYALVWGTSGVGPAKYQLLDAAGNPIGAPARVSDGTVQAGWARIMYSPEQGKFLISYTKILAIGRHQRVARFATYVGGALVLGTEIIIDTWSGNSAEASGMAYSRGRFLITWWNWDANPAFPQTFVTILDAAGTPLVTKMRVTTDGDGQTDPEIACDQNRGRCLVIGQAWGVFSADGRTPGTWGAVISDETGAVIKNAFYAGRTDNYLHAGPIEKEPTLTYSAAGDRFILGFSNLQNTVLAMTVDAATLTPAAAFVVRSPNDDPAAGGGFGRPRLAYNPTTQSSIMAIKPWIARTGAIELDGNGAIVPNTWQMTPAVTDFSHGTQEIAQAADPRNARFLIADQQAYLTIRATVFGGGATTPSLITPANNTTLTGTSQTFSWNAGSGVSSYFLEVGNSPGAADIFSQNVGPVTSVSVAGLPIDGRALHATLWWFKNGAWSSAAYTFTAYTPPAPPIPAMPILTTPTLLTSTTSSFTWTGDSAATWYWVWVQTTTGTILQQGWFLSTDVCSGVSCRYIHSSPLAPGNYYQWIMAYGPGGYSGWSPRRDITLTLPAGPTSLVSATGSTPVTFTWTAASNASWYRIMVINAATPAVPEPIPASGWLETTTLGCTSTCSISYTPTAGGTFYWWIMPWSAGGGAPWSERGSFVR
jgi:hypothetical protein